MYFSVGRHDGVFNGKRYFSCLPEHGVMLPMNDVICIITEKVRPILQENIGHIEKGPLLHQICSL